MKDIAELLKKVKKSSKEINMAKTKQKDQIKGRATYLKQGK